MKLKTKEETETFNISLNDGIRRYDDFKILYESIPKFSYKLKPEIRQGMQKLIEEQNRLAMVIDKYFSEKNI